RGRTGTRWELGALRTPLRWAPLLPASARAVRRAADPPSIATADEGAMAARRRHGSVPAAASPPAARTTPACAAAQYRTRVRSVPSMALSAARRREVISGVDAMSITT